MIIHCNKFAGDDLYAGRTCNSIPLKMLSLADLARVYAYRVVVFGCNHVQSKLALDEVERRGKEIDNEIADIIKDAKLGITSVIDKSDYMRKCMKDTQEKMDKLDEEIDELHLVISEFPR